MEFSPVDANVGIVRFNRRDDTAGREASTFKMGLFEEFGQ